MLQYYLETVDPLFTFLVEAVCGTHLAQLHLSRLRPVTCHFVGTLLRRHERSFLVTSCEPEVVEINSIECIFSYC